MVSQLSDMLVERLLVYEKKNKVLPSRVLVYRDGVSEVSRPCPSVFLQPLITYVGRDHRDSSIRLLKKNCLRF